MNPTKKVVWAIIVIIVALVIVFLLKANTTASKETIKIGYIGPFTGPVAGTSGEDIGNGWKLAVSKRNTLAGKKVEVVYEDDACDPKKAVSAAQKLISVDKVNIVVNGVCSGSMIAAMPITEAAKVILFTPVSTSPKITDGGDYVFRTSASSVHTARAMSETLKKLGYSKIGIIFENAEYTVGLKEAVVRGAESANIAIIAEEGINPQESDMRSQILKINAQKPDAFVVIMNSTITASSFVKQSKELGITLPVIGNEYFAFKAVVENPDAEGIYASQYKYDDKAPALVAFLEEYEKMYNKKPSQDIYSILAFDGYNILADALEKCKGDDPECVRDELYKVKDYAGVSGMITIDEKGDTNREFTIKKIMGGKLVTIE